MCMGIYMSVYHMCGHKGQKFKLLHGSWKMNGGIL